MYIKLVKTCFCLLLLIAFAILAFTSKDAVNSQIFASLAIIIGALTLKNLSTKNQIKNE